MGDLLQWASDTIEDAISNCQRHFPEAGGQVRTAHERHVGNSNARPRSDAAKNPVADFVRAYSAGNGLTVT
ncbi:hypothetical protein AAV95_05510 [Mycolicibacterium elephantis]|nr:hypothetical protein AAV95_05510 [Mycolicibacterium elephantis]